MINLVAMEVRLGKDPVLRYTASETAVCNLDGANNIKYKDKEYTSWFRIVCWRNLAEIASKYLAKSSHINVVGNLQTRDWTGDDGIKRYVTEIRAREISFLDKKGTTMTASEENGAQPQAETTPGDVPEDDIPF